MTENLLPLTDVSKPVAESAGGGCCGGDGCGCGTTASGTSAASVEYLVNGMTCQHCVASITEELSELPGVTGVTVELNVGSASRVRVTSELPLHRDEVSSAISEAGYTLV